MSKLNEDTYLSVVKNGEGKGIIEILNIGFEPLLTNEEWSIYEEIGRLKGRKYNYEKALKILDNILQDKELSTEAKSWFVGNYNSINESFVAVKELIDEKKLILKDEMIANTSTTRTLHTDRTYTKEDQYRNIAIFESSLTRTFGCTDMQHCYDIVSVVTYYTEIFDAIVHNGFYYMGNKYIFFTAGAGQTRNKKSTFVSEEMFNRHQNSLFCGLTKEMVNESGGMNTNKYLAYTSLCQTNSSIWKDFNIDRAIVVPDIEYMLPNQEVRNIYLESLDDKEMVKSLKDELYEINCKQREFRKLKEEHDGEYKPTKDELSNEALRKKMSKEIRESIKNIHKKYHKTSIENMDISIPFTDGFGISFVKMNSSMIRLPFIKGLESYMDRNVFKSFCRKNGYKINKIVDIYGKEHSIDDVDFIFTESQFKMHKYYKNVVDSEGAIIKTGWDVYVELFKKYNCEACVCNVEKKVKLNAKTNYQILQTLTTEMTDEEILNLGKYDIDNLNGIGHDVNCMLRVLGADEDKNNNLTWLQKSLLLYPEMLKERYVKNSLVNTKESMIRKFRSGKFNINGAYTFAIPDPIACLQWWFCGERDLNKLGVIEEGTVVCSLFNDGQEVDCLRSPHLDHAHCIRKNVNTVETRKLFKSKGVYIGVKDNMSKLLMYDNDGDKLLMHDNMTIIDCAKRFQEKYKMIPNYYELLKANAEQITNDTLFNGIVLAYHHGNIGTPSNEITKVFSTLSPESSKEEVEEAIEIVSLRCADVNATIDYAKTLYKPEVPKDVSDRYKKYSKLNVPHFFKYAKNKKSNQVEPIGKCNIDRIHEIVKMNRITFKDLLGSYSCETLMNQSCDFEINDDDRNNIVSLYIETDEVTSRRLQHEYAKCTEQDEKKKIEMQLQFDGVKQKEMFLSMFPSIKKDAIINLLLKELHNEINKDLLWRWFGEEIHNNIKKNLKGTVVCTKCHERFMKEEVKRGMCPGCRKDDIEENEGMQIKKCIGYEGYDCNETFLVDARNMSKCRCDECQKEQDVILNRAASRERMRKYREKRKNK